MPQPGTTVVETLVTDVRLRLAEAGDAERAPAMQAYMKSELPFHGISSPALKALMRHVLADPLPTREDWEAAVRLLWDEATHREEWYAALALAGHRHYRAYQDTDALGLYRHLVVTGAWWDVVDETASRRVGPILRSHHDEVVPVIRDWAVHDDLWLRRSAVICQLGAKHRTDTDLLRFALEHNLEDSPHGRVFWIRKAVGWALRQHARVDAGWVHAFVDEHADRLSGLSRREALKHL